MKENNHFLQSKYWQEIKSALGNPTTNIKGGFFQKTKVPLLKKYIGYMPRVYLESLDWNQLYEKAQEENCIAVTIDPLNLSSEIEFDPKSSEEFIVKKGQPVHLQKNVVIDLTKSESEMLMIMKQKTRYNIRLAEKKGIRVEIGSNEENFEIFLKLYQETMDRQEYAGRSENYLRKVWKKLKEAEKTDQVMLTTIATAYYNELPLVSWMLFLYKDTVYYPYGGSSEKFKNLMAPYALAWEICKWGKDKGYTSFDLWGLENDLSDGFSRFKTGFTDQIVEYANTIDLVISPGLYRLYKIVEKLREKFSFLKKFL